MATSAGSPMVIKFYKLVTIKQKDWISAQQEKITAELQLLKAQVHPHFLLSTLSNIHSFSLGCSPKTPVLILKLSSLLSYMLYDCKENEVRLEKEIEAMKNYIELEKDRHGNKIEVSWNLEGHCENKFISPLLLLPFLENAFNHSLADEIEKPWLSIDISVKSDALRCKIVNSKNEFLAYTKSGVGISNVKKRLEISYPDRHELKINDEGNFFVVSLLVKLVPEPIASSEIATQTFVAQRVTRARALPAYR
jgi:LytS/YehU family sensor histidine kinase